MWSKLAINAYVAQRGVRRSCKRGIRINAILPGPTDTPLAQANADLWLSFGADYREETGIEASHPARAGLPAGLPLQRRRGLRQRASPSSTDAGYFASGITESFPAATPAVDFLNSEF